MIGIVFTLLVALVFDLILVTIGRIVLPWSRRDPRTARSGLRSLVGSFRRAGAGA